MYKIAAENLQALFHKIAADQDLYLPVKVSDQVNFKAWSEDAEVCLDTLKTVKSPKDAFFPQSENLYTCKKEEKNISIEPQALQEKDFVVFGMKACDVPRPCRGHHHRCRAPDRPLRPGSWCFPPS